MIYFARFFSLIGGIVAAIGIFTILIMVLLENKGLISQDLQDQGPLVLFVTFLAALLLVMGQLCGNDLFRLTGKDSVLALKEDPDNHDRNRYYDGLF